jgi:hypothetical protein
MCLPDAPPDPIEICEAAVNQCIEQGGIPIVDTSSGEMFYITDDTGIRLRGAGWESSYGSDGRFQCSLQNCISPPGGDDEDDSDESGPSDPFGPPL